MLLHILIFTFSQFHFEGCYQLEKPGDLPIFGEKFCVLRDNIILICEDNSFTVRYSMKNGILSVWVGQNIHNRKIFFGSNFVDIEGARYFKYIESVGDLCFDWKTAKLLDLDVDIPSHWESELINVGGAKQFHFWGNGQIVFFQKPLTNDPFVVVEEFLRQHFSNEPIPVEFHFDVEGDGSNGKVMIEFDAPENFVSKGLFFPFGESLCYSFMFSGIDSSVLTEAILHRLIKDVRDRTSNMDH